MKIIITIMILFTSFLTHANYWPNTGWEYATDVCVAQTVCPDGRQIYCTVYGINYGYGQGELCRTRVVPGRLIHCQGYSQDIYNNWTPVNIPLQCF